MKAVYKYKLKLFDTQEVEIPQGAQLLTVQLQGEFLCLWALCNPNRPDIKRKIRIAGTGRTILEEIVGYIGTVQMQNGILVFHVFEIK